MSEAGVRGIDLFKMAGESISGWIPSFKTGGRRASRQPFCSLLEERLLLYLEYHPQVVWYGRGDISAAFASPYRVATPLPTPFPINYLFEGKAPVYLPDAIGQFHTGSLLIAEAGLWQDKRRERNQAKAEAARKVAHQQAGVYWIGTEATLSRTRQANRVFLHARRQTFPAWQELEEALQVIWPAGEAACIEEVVERLGERWPRAEREAAAWKRCADAAAHGQLLVDLANVQLTRLVPLICLAPDAPPMLPDPLPSEVEGSSDQAFSEPRSAGTQDDRPVSIRSTFDASILASSQRERGSRATCELSRRSRPEHPSARQHEQRAWVAPPWVAWCCAHANGGKWLVCPTPAPAESERCILPFKKPCAGSMPALPDSRSAPLPSMPTSAASLHASSRTPAPPCRSPLTSRSGPRCKPSTRNESVREEREQLPAPRRERQSPHSFARSIPAPAQLAQLDEHRLDLSVITPEGIPSTSRVHAAVLSCVKTAASLSAVLA